MRFETAKEIDEWAQEHIKKCKTQAFDGTQFQYEFFPTGIVEDQTVRCKICKEKHTAYSEW